MILVPVFDEVAATIALLVTLEVRAIQVIRSIPPLARVRHGA
jgi:hypothetical protein